MNGLRRYEILVPLLFNDGRPVPEPLLAQTAHFDQLEIWITSHPLDVILQRMLQRIANLRLAEVSLGMTDTGSAGRKAGPADRSPLG